MVIFSRRKQAEAEKFDRKERHSEGQGRRKSVSRRVTPTRTTSLILIIITFKNVCFNWRFSEFCGVDLSGKLVLAVLCATCNN